MPEMRRVFFVFNNKGVLRLAASRELLQDIDYVISAAPGISLDKFDCGTGHMTLEEALDAFGISQRSISESASDLSLSLLDAESLESALPSLWPGTDESVRLALLNHVGLLTHNAFAFEALFKALLRNGMVEARAFRARGRYRMIERLDIRTLLQNDLSFWQHLEHMCEEGGVMITAIGSGERFSSLKNALRDFLLLGYKWKTLLDRSLRAARQAQQGACELAVVVRAGTEVAGAAPILDSRAGQGRKDVMLVDDLIKSPNASLAAAASGRPWIALHSFSRPMEIVSIFARCIFLRRKAAREAMAANPDRAVSAGFLGRPEIAREVLYTAFASVPELLVHRLQITRALDRLSPQAIVSFDTVDRWGAMQGELARQRQVRSVMIQNTAVDDIVYPWPMSMDHLVVGNERLRQVFIASGADPKHVHAFGLPIHDEIILAGDERLQQLCVRAAEKTLPLRVLIATQPFVQEYDYNAALLEDFETATNALEFDVEWILKPHPREVAGKYKHICVDLRRRGKNITLFKGPFEKALSNADIVLSRTSTGLEFAALGGVPGVAHLNRYPIEIVERLDYLKSDVTAKTLDVNALREFIKNFTPGERLKALRNYAELRSRYIDTWFSGKGHATVRVIDLIVSGRS